VEARVLVELAERPAANPDWSDLAFAVISSAVVASIIGAVLNYRRDLAAVRRERYAAAVSLLAARAEYPYRIRRRTSDDLAVLAALAERGHELQERLAEARAWISSESPALGRMYAQALQRIDSEVAMSAASAWSSPPVTTAQGMNLVDFGPRNTQQHIEWFQGTTRFRFGWRRLTPNWLVSRWFLRTDEPIP
jgi:hypothetical protein